MDAGTKSFLGWAGIVLGVLVILSQFLVWPGYLQYLWGVLVAVAGIWILAAKA